jgi:hypothetical protein
MPPLHLIVEADTEDKLDAGVRFVKSRMGRMPVRAYSFSAVVLLGMPAPLGMDVAKEMAGPDGEYLQHVMREASCECEVIGPGAPAHMDMSTQPGIYIGASRADWSPPPPSPYCSPYHSPYCSGRVTHLHPCGAG